MSTGLLVVYIVTLLVILFALLIYLAFKEVNDPWCDKCGRDIYFDRKYGVWKHYEESVRHNPVPHYTIRRK